MSNISKKTFIYILCGWLAFSSAFITYQKSYSYAMEWAGVTIALDTALKALLGTIGITAGVGMASEVDWGAVRNDCMEFQQNQGSSAVEVGEWWSDIISGSLNTASDCWDSFKQWATSLTATQSGGGVSSGKHLYTPEELCDTLNSIMSTVQYNTSFTFTGDLPVSCYGFVVYNISQTNLGLMLFLDNKELNLNGKTISASDGSSFSVSGMHIIGWQNTYSLNRIFSSVGTIQSSFNIDNVGDRPQYGVFLSGVNVVSTDLPCTILSSVDDPSIPSEDGLFQSIDNSVVNNLEIVNKGDTIINEGDQVINLPWERVGDTASAVEEVIQGLIDRVNDGTLSLENYTENIQNITNTYVYETTNNHIFPDPGNTDDTIDDKINENKSNVGFTLFGLERFFPFCIPWDIYAFLGLLESEPQAPQINIPFPDPVTKEVDVYVLDLSPLEPVATVLRYGFDLIFIIGLSLATRRLIGAGGD